jgi:hypothetical protein
MVTKLYEKMGKNKQVYLVGRENSIEGLLMGAVVLGVLRRRGGV